MDMPIIRFLVFEFECVDEGRSLPVPLEVGPAERELEDAGGDEDVEDAALVSVTVAPAPVIVMFLCPGTELRLDGDVEEEEEAEEEEKIEGEFELDGELDAAAVVPFWEEVVVVELQK